MNYPTMWKDLTEEIKKNYPYIKDEIDIRAFDAYIHKWPFHYPPTRPNGFLDKDEKATWKRWRDRVKGT